MGGKGYEWKREQRWRVLKEEIKDDTLLYGLISAIGVWDGKQDQHDQTEFWNGTDISARSCVYD